MKSLSFLVGLLCAFAPGALRAQDLTDTVITSDHFESVSTEKEMTTTFWSNVELVGTDIHLTCDRLVVISTSIGDKTQVVTNKNRFKSLVATGKVKVVQGTREANCGRAVVLPNEDKVTLTEKPVVIDHDADVTFIGEPVVLLRGERKVFGENVKIILPAMKDLGFDKNKALDLPTPTAKPEEKK
jgi:lipopolysaccharide export system protein LptA